MFASGNGIDLGMVILDGEDVSHLFHFFIGCVGISWCHGNFSSQLSQHTILPSRWTGEINPRGS